MKYAEYREAMEGTLCSACNQPKLCMLDSSDRQVWECECYTWTVRPSLGLARADEGEWKSPPWSNRAWEKEKIRIAAGWMFDATPDGWDEFIVQLGSEDAAKMLDAVERIRR